MCRMIHTSDDIFQISLVSILSLAYLGESIDTMLITKILMYFKTTTNLQYNIYCWSNFKDKMTKH
ncbi:hypothetical protein HanRHA438_Chr03g0115501 [Helianthus annuus]|nr:hypothetical protein HanRHA438_Chr03g0115501 [Helianthus annuus]